MAQNNIVDSNKDSKEKGPLLAEELSVGERLMLGQMTHHGGYGVLRKLMDAICDRATKDLIRLDPENPEYERKVGVRTQRARDVNETCSDLLKSIKYHVEAVESQERAEEAEAVDIVSKTYGIHRDTRKAMKNTPDRGVVE